MKYIDFINEGSDNNLIVFHGGDIEGNLKSPFYVTEDEYMAKSYGETVYSFNMSNDVKILDLTDHDTFIKVKSRVYDNYSKLYPKYLNQGWSSDESHKRLIENNMEVLSKYKNYDEIKKDYFDIKTSNIFDEIPGLRYGFQGAYDDDAYVRDYLKGIDKKTEIYKTLKSFLLLHWVVSNMNKLSDSTLNEFGYFFVDYCVENNYDVYKAVSSDSSGQLRMEEYCVINVSILKEKKEHLFESMLYLKTLNEFNESNKFYHQKKSINGQKFVPHEDTIKVHTKDLLDITNDEDDEELDDNEEVIDQELLDLENSFKKKDKIGY
jgi:hypothetical protein